MDAGGRARSRSPRTHWYAVWLNWFAACAVYCDCCAFSSLSQQNNLLNVERFWRLKALKNQTQRHCFFSAGLDWSAENANKQCLCVQDIAVNWRGNLLSFAPDEEIKSGEGKVKFVFITTNAKNETDDAAKSNHILYRLRNIPSVSEWIALTEPLQTTSYKNTFVKMHWTIYIYIYISFFRRKNKRHQFMRAKWYFSHFIFLRQFGVSPFANYQWDRFQCESQSDTMIKSDERI